VCFASGSVSAPAVALLSKFLYTTWAMEPAMWVLGQCGMVVLKGEVWAVGTISHAFG
jgi:hypothetical protein